MGQYSTYLSQTRQLLHDTGSNAWSDTTLVGYINEGRRRVAKDTYCLRDLAAGLVLTAGVERYVPSSFVTLPSYARAVAGVCGIDIYYGNSRYPLTYLPWRQFSLKLRYWQNLQQIPVAWSYIGTNAVYVGCIPDQGYTTDWDCAFIPIDLTSDSQTEVLPAVYQDAVQFWAARCAKINEQTMGESQFFEKQYWAEIGLDSAAFQRFQYAPR